MDNFINLSLRKTIAKHILAKYSYGKIERAALSLLIEAITIFLIKFLSRVKNATVFAKRSRTTIVDLLNIIDMYELEIPLNIFFNENIKIEYTFMEEFDHSKEFPPVHTYKATPLEIEYNMRDAQVLRRQEQVYTVRRRILKQIEQKRKKEKIQLNFIFE